MVARFACGAGHMALQPDPREGRDRRAAILVELLADQRRRLLAQARFHSSRVEDADDALSDACVQFLRFYSGPPGDEALHWMLTVVKRCAWAINRRHDRREVEVTAAIVDGSDRGSPAEAAERAEDTSEVSIALAQLKPEEREALILRGFGLSHPEIAARRGWSLTKVRRLLREGRAKVRELVEGGVNP
jgi:RNA polymerase sigma factor (sigma-70 family)